MLYTICIALILVASVLVILAVLVQNPKSGMAANFGASNQVMGVRETTNFLEKFTWSMAIAIVVLSLAATLAMDRGLVADSNLEISKDAKASGAGHRIRGRRYDAAGRDSLCRTDRAAAGRVASALRPETPEGGGDLAVIEDRGFFPRSFFRPSGGGPAWDDSSGGPERSRSRDPGGAALQWKFRGCLPPGTGR